MVRKMIQLKNVSKYYYSQTAVALGLRNVSLEFGMGEFVVITGESGSGKSTLLNVISGMDTYEEGELYIAGHPTSFFDETDWEAFRKEHISTIYQSYNLIDSYTALENIESVLMIAEKDGEKMSAKSRREKARECLEKVGLGKQARQRASHLSSGQKQRLGIARALAKDTDIIIADEPTGNLDVENGNQVMELLHQLSKERLVVVVTHNYEQAEPYASRKIRLYDGEVVEDRVIHKEQSSEELPETENTNHEEGTISEQTTEMEETTISEETEKKKWDIKRFLHRNRIAWKFVHLNRKAQPRRTIFLISFLLLSVFANFLFYGSYLSNLDDTSTKVFTNEGFFNQEKTRLVVRRLDGGAITQEDINKMAKIRHVKQADKYDAVNDVNYFYLEKEDYDVEYLNRSDDFTNKITVKPKDYTKYMRSASGLKKSDLAEGKLPEAYNEVVIASGGKEFMGKEIPIYFSNQRMWKQSQIPGFQMKVVGILKEEGQQLYFSEDFCQVIGVRHEKIVSRIQYTQVKAVTYSKGDREDYSTDSEKDVVSITILNPSLTGKQVKLPNNVLIDLVQDKKEGDSVRNEYIKEEGAVCYKEGDGEYQTTDATIVTDSGSLGSLETAEVSREIFDILFPDRNSYQMSVYIEDYAYIDDVLDEINKNQKDWEALSVYRVSATKEYIPEKTQERITTLLISIGALLIIFFLDVVLVYAMMKLKQKDLIILKSLGMEHQTVKCMNYQELVSSVLIAQGINFILIFVLNQMEIERIVNLSRYYHISDYVLLTGIAILLGMCIGFFYNRYLNRKFRVTE